MTTTTKIITRRGVGEMLAAVASALLTVVAQPAVAATSNSLEFTSFKFGSVDVKIGAIPTAVVSRTQIGAYNTKIGTDPSI